MSFTYCRCRRDSVASVVVDVVLMLASVAAFLWVVDVVMAEGASASAAVLVASVAYVVPAFGFLSSQRVTRRLYAWWSGEEMDCPVCDR